MANEMKAGGIKSKGEEEEEMMQVLQPTTSCKYLGTKLQLLSVSMRIAAAMATATAAVVMGVNKQSRTMTVAIVGTTPLLQTFSATFHQAPAFLYFVIANATASLYNLAALMLVSAKLRAKDCEIWVQLLDTVILCVMATGAAAAASVAELGKHGNMHWRWNAICERFQAFCTRGEVAIVAAVLGLLFLFIVTQLSTLALHKNNIQPRN